MSAWRRYDSHLIPAFHERFEERWGEGTAPFLDPEAARTAPARARSGSTWTPAQRWPWCRSGPPRTASTAPSGCSTCRPPGTSGCSGPGFTGYLEPAADEAEQLLSLRNDAFKKAVAHAKEFLFGPEGGNVLSAKPGARAARGGADAPVVARAPAGA